MRKIKESHSAMLMQLASIERFVEAIRTSKPSTALLTADVSCMA
jgi:hypothetical protein